MKIGPSSDLNFNCKARNRETCSQRRLGSGKPELCSRKHTGNPRRECFVINRQGGEIESEAHFPSATGLAGNIGQTVQLRMKGYRAETPEDT